MALNGAVSGYSAVQGERLFERLKWVQPDVIVFWFGINDAKPAHGAPDAALHTPSPAARAVWDAVGGWRIAQLAAWLAQADAADQTRVPAPEFAQIVEHFRELERREGKPRLIFVRFPERMYDTLVQLRRLVEIARAAEADEICAPAVLLLPYSPAPDSMLQRHETVDRRGRRVTVFGDPAAATHTLSVDDVAVRAARLERWHSSLEELLTFLPADAVTPEELFADLAPDEIYVDNCHLTPLGARYAAEALAERVCRSLGCEHSRR